MNEKRTSNEVDEESEIMGAALSDPDAQPSSPDKLAKMVRMPHLRSLRRRLNLTQEQFAERYEIPVASIRDWEQRRTTPDKAVRTYLRVIALEPGIVAEIVARRPPHSAGGTEER